MKVCRENAALTVRVCHRVPRIPKEGTVIGVEQPIKERADLILLRSAVIDRVSAILHTHEVTGSSPVAPTTRNYLIDRE